MAPRCRHVVVLDCDGTLTPKGKALLPVIDVRAVTPEATASLQALRDKYLARALSGELSPAQERDWLGGCLEIYVRLGLNLARGCSAVAELPIRPGVRDCLRELRRRHIPVAVVSYGVAEFIEAYLARHRCLHLVRQIYAARLFWHQGGEQPTGYDRRSLVVPSNKGWWSRRFARLYRVPPSRILAVGDSGSDRTLGGLRENRFGLAKDETEAGVIAPFMGETAIDDSFDPATEWLLKKIET